MAEEIKDREAGMQKEVAEISFKCRQCGELRPLAEMNIVSGLFPRVVACRDCETKMR